MKQPHATQNAPDLIDVLTEFRCLQITLVEKLKLGHPMVGDWEYLTGLPRHGAIVLGGQHWDFHVHGTGVSFIEQSSGLHINCHSGLAAHADAFDPGRIVEFLKSRGISRVRIGGKEVTFDFDNAWKVLADLCRNKIVNRCDLLPNWHYQLG